MKISSAFYFLSLIISSIALPSRAAEEKPIEKPVDVLIVGAGLAGLSTAYRLQKAGLTYKIIEISPHVGGRIRTATYANGTSAELGLEEFWEGNATLEIIKELKVPTEPSATSFSSFYTEGKLYPFLQNTNTEFLHSIFSASELTAYYVWDEKMSRLRKQALLKPLSSELNKLMKVSFSDWVSKEKGLSKRMREFIRLQVEPEFANSWNNISALEGLFEWHIFSGAGSNSWHVVGGNQKLPEAIAEKIGTKNIILNTKVTRIESKPNEVSVDAVDQGSFQQRHFVGRYVVTTMPIYRLLEVQFVPALSDERKDAIRTQGWGSYFTAHVTLEPDAAKFFRIGKESALPILQEGALGCVYGDLPEKEDTPVLLNLLLHGSEAERFNMRASTAMDEARKELSMAFAKRWPGIEKLIKGFEFHQYHPRAIASWPVGRSRLDALSDSLRAPQGRVYFAGDYTEGTHSDGAAQSAIRVTDQIGALQKK